MSVCEKERKRGVVISLNEKRKAPGYIATTRESNASEKGDKYYLFSLFLVVQTCSNIQENSARERERWIMENRMREGIRQ